MCSTFLIGCMGWRCGDAAEHSSRARLGQGARDGDVVLQVN